MRSACHHTQCLVGLIVANKRLFPRVPLLQIAIVDFGNAANQLITIIVTRPCILYLKLVDQDKTYFVALRMSGRLQLRWRCQFVKLKAQFLTEEIFRSYDFGIGHI